MHRSASVCRRLVWTVAVAILTPAWACGGAQKKSDVEVRMDTVRSEQQASVLLDRGKGFLSVGDITRAEEYLSGALDAGADPKAVMPLLLSACVRGGRIRVAIDYAETYAKQHPEDPEILVVLGALYSGISEYDHARQRLERALLSRPLNAEAHYALAVALREQHEFGSADEHFRTYLKLQPNGSHAREVQASLLQSLPSAK